MVMVAIALVPGGLGDGEVEEDHAVGGLSDVDLVSRRRVGRLARRRGI